MNPPQVATPTSALPARPERPTKYVWPVTTPDGSVGYDHPLDNYFDASMATRLLPSKSPTRLYDTIARAHDHRFQVTPDMVDPSTTPRPLILNPRERRRSLAKLPANSPEYMGISSELPGWRPRRSSYEDRRGAVGVTPSEVNTLVPYIPPIDTSLPPPSREWLDARAKEILADANAEFGNSHHNATNDVTKPESSLNMNDSDFFDYDTDSTLDRPATISRSSIPMSSQQTPQIESDSNSRDADFDSNTDTDTDTDTDMDSDDGYNWSITRISESNPLALSGVPRWIIPRKRPSVVIANKKDVTNDSNEVCHTTSPSSDRHDPVHPPSSDDEHTGKRRRGGKSMCLHRSAKTPKRHANDTPARQGRKSIGIHISESEEHDSFERATTLPLPAPTSSLGGGTTTSPRPPISAITATALQMRNVQIASPSATSPGISLQPDITSTPPKPFKVYPCHLDGCTQICASAGDLQRHQQSLRHRAPSHTCLACGKSYTRSDALKRHLNSKASCKRVHATKPVNGAEEEEVQAEANEEAV